jgi:uncharacterized protein (TIGR03437 family)
MISGLARRFRKDVHASLEGRMQVRVVIATGLRLVGLVLAAAVVGSAHPEFGTNSIVNSASFMPVALNGGKIARGSIFTIFGTDMGPGEGVGNYQYPLQKNIGGVTVKIISGAQTFDSIPLFANQTQLNAVMPSAVPVGPAKILVNYVGGVLRPNSAEVDVQIVESSFGAFTILGTGHGPAVLQNYIAAGNTPFNSLLEGATPGQIVILWGTGLGPINAPDSDPAPAGTLPVDVQILLGGKQVTNIQYAGRSPCCSGLDQIVFQVPADTPLGCYVPLIVRVGQVVGNSTTISVSADGGKCADPLNRLTQAPAFGPQIYKLGYLGLQKTALTDTASAQTLVTDQVTGVFGSPRRPEWFFDPAISLPALGSCLSYQYNNRSGGLVLRPYAQGGAAVPADAGATLNVTGGLGSAAVPRVSGYYLGFYGPVNGSSPVIAPGTPTVSSQGGVQVGAFQKGVTFSGGPAWNSASIPLVTRSEGALVQWSSVPPGTDHVRIMGVSESSLDASNNQNGVFICTAPAEATSFFVPAVVLANIPRSATAGGALGGAIYIGASPAQAAPTFAGAGIEIGIVDAVSYVGRLVEFR